MSHLTAQSRLDRLNLKRQTTRPAAGSAPGTLVKPIDAESTTVTVSTAGKNRYSRQSLAEHGSLSSPLEDASAIRWIDVQGLADAKRIRLIGEALNLHPLVIEDLMHTSKRPKAEIHDDFFIVFLREPRGGPPFDSEQIAIVAGKNFVLTVQERHGDIFDPIRRRLQAGLKRLADIGPSYLAYALIDTIIDNYFPILDAYGDVTDKLEQQVIEDNQPELIAEIHVLKRELMEMRRALASQREAINTLLRQDGGQVPKSLTIFLRDCADHSFQLLDAVEVYREVAQGLAELHLTRLSNRMNEVMKVLTIISTIFMPMTFIVGIYGMNFDTSSPFNMPELGWRFGYIASLLLMIIIAVIMLIYFRRKGWILK